MSGGHVGWVFFFNKVSEYSDRLRNELPETSYTAQEEEAGFMELSQTFGFYQTLDTVARYVGEDDEQVLKWSTSRFYNKLKLLAWRAHVQNKYQKIVSKKM